MRRTPPEAHLDVNSQLARFGPGGSKRWCGSFCCDLVTLARIRPMPAAKLAGGDLAGACPKVGPKDVSLMIGSSLTWAGRRGTPALSANRPRLRGRGLRQMQTAWTKGKAAKLTREFCCVRFPHSARNFHALGNSHFCESTLSSGNFASSMVYWSHSRMLCRSTFVAEGHAKSDSHRVDFPLHSPVSCLTILGNHPYSHRHGTCGNIALMKATLGTVQSTMHRGAEFSRRALDRVNASNSNRDAVCADQQQRLAASAGEYSRQVCVQLCVRYTPL